jgi:phosphoribosylformimino-5-aminoimidazole carboxamide ribotide isomerase
MQIIPVLDIKGGLVVRAIAGRRQNYRPIASSLADSAKPLDVALSFLRLYPFRTIYIADLDAIMGRGDNLSTLQDLARRLPLVRFWIDAGRAAPPPGAALERIFGSETLAPDAPPPDFSTSAETILSLDFRDGDFLGPPSLLAAPHLWPRRVIVMTLARVGLNAGPDLDAIATIKARAGARHIFAAGGVRGVDDLGALAEAGAAGALVASALHDGRLSREDLARLSAAPLSEDKVPDLLTAYRHVDIQGTDEERD